MEYLKGKKTEKRQKKKKFKKNRSYDGSIECKNDLAFANF